MKVFFGGDFYCSPEDCFDMQVLSKVIGDENLLIINYEGFHFPAQFISKSIFKKKVTLEQNTRVLDCLPANIYLSLVNNHSTDFGLKPYAYTRSLLQNQGGINLLNHPQKLPLPGHPEEKILFFADAREDCCVGYKTKFLRLDKSVIIQNKNLINNSLVYIHGGLENRPDPTLYQRYLSHLLVRYGAKAVIYSHSHCLGTLEVVDGIPVHYGLGNFFFLVSRIFMVIRVIRASCLAMILTKIRMRFFITQSPIINFQFSIRKLNLIPPWPCI